MYRLRNTIRDYAWGSRTALAGLLGHDAPGGPEAELWIGAHPGAPSLAEVPGAAPVPLDRLIEDDPASALGADAAERFGRLPYLAKLLAADAPLSIQVHPTLARAREGFALEEGAGVDRSAAHRNYKDDNHKPEMIFALTPFTALCGFRPADESAALFELLAGRVPEPAAGAARRTAGLLRGGRLREAFTGLLEAPDDVVALVGASAAASAGAGPHDAGLAELPRLEAAYPGDPGVLVSLMLNLVELEPGQAICLPAGNVHAYLRGLGVEVMASSDNVLRGGLTAKHVDIPELLDTVDFEALPVPFVEAGTTELGQEVYSPGFDEFVLQRIVFAAAPGVDAMADDDVPLLQNGPVLVVATAGSMVLDSPRGDLVLERGGSVFVPACEAPVVVKHHGPGPAEAFAVTLP
ncbi:mannose-6-phosphate isomerase, class I [Zafaria sp. J156]|uniref:mannose-6-phosphate isomerase, class I n=1 Tax=Zafaria sp. J156 TaxID=3116490 RepID=UPI002E791D27|nr:mannose-6-phosphate isomerase, class I [Zafaria sp. J156]MEE1619940.1 mannose-6-phosphate isomerase, class I [Zafaria sp. J156]